MKSHFYTLIFFAFLENSKEKPPTRQGCLLPAEPLKSLGKKGKNAENRKEFLEKEKGKGNQKGKEKKIRVCHIRQQVDPAVGDPSSTR